MSFLEDLALGVIKVPGSVEIDNKFVEAVIGWVLVAGSAAVIYKYLKDDDNKSLVEQIYKSNN